MVSLRWQEEGYLQLLAAGEVRAVSYVGPIEKPRPHSCDFFARRKRIRQESPKWAPGVCTLGFDMEAAVWHGYKAFLLPSTTRTLGGKPHQGGCLEKGKKEEARPQNMALSRFGKFGIFAWSVPHEHECVTRAGCTINIPEPV